MFPAQLEQCRSQGVAMASQRIGMTLRLVRRGDFHGGLRHDRTQARGFGLLIEEAQLFVGDAEFGGDLLDAIRNVEQTTFKRGPGHGRECTPSPAESVVGFGGKPT